MTRRSILPFPDLRAERNTTRGSRTQLIEEIEVAAMAEVKKRAFLEGRKRSVRESSRECGSPVAQYMKSVFGV